MRKDNTQNYKTPLTNIRHFRDFTDNVGMEKTELKSMKRSQMKNSDGPNLATLVRKKWNKVTKNYSDIDEHEIDDRLEELGEIEEPGHVWKFSNSEVNPNHFFKNNTEVVESHNWDSDGCGCCDDCTGESDCDCCEDCTCSDEEYDSEEDSDCGCDCDDCDGESYMFFGNLETILDMSEEMMGMDEHEVDELLSSGHNWAEDHISTAKESLSHVYNFLKGQKEEGAGKMVKKMVMGVEDFFKKISENHTSNYMFFSNLEHINRFCQEILDMDRDMIDEKLTSGHDWAEDHVSAAKENIQQVYDWLLSEQN